MKFFTALLALLIGTTALHADTFYVSNLSDSGTGSLRQALADAAFNGQSDTITFLSPLSGGTITLTGSELFVNNSDGGTFTIDASNLPGGITIQRASGASGYLFYNSGTLTLKTITFRGGSLGSGQVGGAIQNYGTMTLERCTLTGNTADYGGAIYNGGDLTLRQCTVANNSAGYAAGGIYSSGVSTGTTKLVHCTIFGNSAPNYNGIYVDTHSSLELQNTIVAGITGGPDITHDGPLILTGANLIYIGVAGSGSTSGTGTMINGNPHLKVLSDNFGPTQTMLPLPNSPAIDAAVGSTETIDQRGVPRPIDGNGDGTAAADIGAVEYASTDADLANLTLSSGSLSPRFDFEVTSYTAVAAADSITVTPTVEQSAATIMVNGMAVVSGAASDPIGLNYGDNTISIVVTAQDTFTTNTYTIVVTRASPDADLAGLALSAGTLSPAFTSANTSYTASVPFETDSIAITPTTDEAHATVKVNGGAVASGSASGNLSLNVGDNIIGTVVTAQDGTKKTYTVTVTRRDNANLAALTLSEGALTPTFTSTNTSYTTVVSNATTSITVTPTVAQANATVTVNGAPVASGTASNSIPLSMGANTITVAVTAPIGPTIIPYTITVFRPYLVSVTNASGPGSLRQAIIDAESNPGPDVIVFASGLSGQTIDFTGGTASINSNAGLTIDASTVPGGVAISGGDTNSIFGVQGSVTLISLTIAHGGVFASGAVSVSNGNLSLIECTLRDNSTSNSEGGAVLAYNSSLTADRCTFVNNSSIYGGAIFTSGNSSAATLRQCTFAGNSASGDSGAIGITGGTAEIVHCTVSGNSAPNGGGIVTRFLTAAVTIENSIVAGNTGTYPDLYNFGTTTVKGANIIQAGISNSGTVTGDGTFAQVDPQLFPLGNYGGPTQTMLPMPGSPAIDAAVGSTLTIDQRGVPRPLDADDNGTAIADIGSVEAQSTNANLSNLALSAGTLNPSFDSSITSYTAKVASTVMSLTATPTSSSAYSTITVNGNAVASGMPSDSIGLNPGDNPIHAVVTAQDGTVKTYTVTVHRNILPTLTLPTSPVSAIASGIGGVAVNFDVSAHDAEDGTLAPMLSAQSGDTFPLGTTTVNVSATDLDGEMVQGSFDVVVHLAAPVNTEVIGTGWSAPGANTNGLPSIAKIASFSPPATDDEGDHAFVAKWINSDGSAKGTGLFLNDLCLAIVGGDASFIGGDGAKWKSFSDPVVDAGHLVCLATLSGVPKAASQVIVGNLAGSSLQKIAATGDHAPGNGVGGAPFKKFIAASVQGNRVAFLAQLKAGTGAPKVTSSNDTGVWYFEPGNLQLVMREGDPVGSQTIKTLVSFLPGNGSPGQGRGTLIQTAANGDAEVTALAIFTNKTQGIIRQNVTSGSQSVELSLSGDAATGLGIGDVFASYSIPSSNSAETAAFLGKLAISGNITKATASGIFTGPDMAGKFAEIASVGGDASEAGTGAIFSLLKDPVLSDDGSIAFPATVKSSTVKGPGSSTLWWWKPATDSLTLLAQGGAEPNDLPGAKWKAFTSLAIAGGGRGPIFVATLTPNHTNVTPASATGIWATDYQDQLHLLFRTGIPDAILPGKTLKSFTILQASVGSTGVTRSFNNQGQLVWLANFTDKTQAIITTNVP